MPRFRKKPVEIEAYQWTGPWCRGDLNMPRWLRDALSKNGGPGTVESTLDARLNVVTLEGTMRVDYNDWIIRGVKGELYPCKPDIFEATYEAVF